MPQTVRKKTDVGFEALTGEVMKNSVFCDYPASHPRSQDSSNLHSFPIMKQMEDLLHIYAFFF
jgi:hypothetical protein